MKTLKESILGSMGMGDNKIRYHDIPLKLIEICLEKTAEMFGEKSFWVAFKDMKIYDNKVMYFIRFHQADMKHSKKSHTSTNVTDSEVKKLYKITKEEVEKQSWSDSIAYGDNITCFDVKDPRDDGKSYYNCFRAEYSLFKGTFKIKLWMDKDTVLNYLNDFNKAAEKYNITLKA